MSLLKYTSRRPGIEYEEYIEEYEEYISYLEDSWQHKKYLLTNDECFFEWVNDLIDSKNEIKENEK